MKWGWLKKVVGIAGSAAGAAAFGQAGHPLVRAVLAASTAIEMVSAEKGKAKEDAAIAAVPRLLGGLGIPPDRVNAPHVQDAMRKVMQTWVAVQNAQEAVESALHEFEAAKSALTLVVQDAKG